MSLKRPHTTSLARLRLNLSKELEDALDVLLRRFSVGQDLSSLGIGHKPVRQLCYTVSPVLSAWFSFCIAVGDLQQDVSTRADLSLLAPTPC